MGKLKEYVFDCNNFYILPTLKVDYMFITVAWLFWSKDIKRIYKKETSL